MFQVEQHLLKTLVHLDTNNIETNNYLPPVQHYCSFARNRMVHEYQSMVIIVNHKTISIQEKHSAKVKLSHEHYTAGCRLVPSRTNCFNWLLLTKVHPTLKCSARCINIFFFSEYAWNIVTTFIKRSKKMYTYKMYDYTCM